MTHFILFPIDLYPTISHLDNTKVYLIEEPHYFNRFTDNYKFNILKPVYHRATMRCYHDYLKSKNINCTYIEHTKNWVNIVKKTLKSNQLKLFDPVDRFIENKIKQNFSSYEILDSPRFILSRDDLLLYNAPLRQTSFYIWIRKRENILMNNNKPIGNKMTYDTSNRKPPYPTISQDTVDKDTYNDNKYVVEAFKYLKKTIPSSNLIIHDEHILKFPIDRAQSLVRLNDFIKYKLSNFGNYQDAMVTDLDNSFLYHSGISPMLNIGLLTPREVINAVLEALDTKKNLSDVEGFIRQIIGWREFTRYMYVHHSEKYLNKNYFNAKGILSKAYYTATTNIVPLDTCIKKAFKYGYLHHIERLMLVANYMTLSGINPKEMYKWFMEFSLDSYDWVMEFNIYCMASYSDGGLITSKPYISSSNYILKMSTYKKDNVWNPKWDKLFWDFLKKHKNKIKKIARLSMLLKYTK